MAQSQVYQVVVLGAGGVGKSCLTAQFVQGVWIESYDPTIEDSYTKQIPIDGRQCMLEILDTAGTEQFSSSESTPASCRSIGPTPTQTYQPTDTTTPIGHGFLLVFSITSKNSFNELKALRDTIIQIKGTDQVPMVIVGNKCDLAEERAVSRAHAFAVSHSWNKTHYYETSARSRLNIDQVFTDLCRQMLQADAEQDRFMQAQEAVYGPLGGKSTSKRDLYGRHRRRRRRRDNGPRCVIL
ncbi:ras-domain-containing protein [Xylona heveae TC161]|uniref:Ras-domain-containing protein n=1 Tax=Xylona heveae (strain CBS 132557 / TC161) TaxID=1328760 RepID=A0A165H5V6_XYLHT|nr:ras-domain-containing protein [Xylona heveae TC161]KZF23030.1 ras-domain-containing protein [Xylona heveae TC161]